MLICALPKLTDLVIVVANFIVGMTAVLFLFSVIRYIKFKITKQKTGPEHFMPVFLASLFAMILVSIATLIEAGTSSESSVSSTVTSLIALTISLSAVIPYMVTRVLTDKDVHDMVVDNTEHYVSKVRKDIDQSAKRAKSRDYMSDADISRMLAFNMATSGKPEYLWSASWVMRAIFNALEHNRSAKELGDERPVGHRFLVNCLAILHYDLLKVYGRLKKMNDDDLEAFLLEYNTSSDAALVHDAVLAGKMSGNSKTKRLLHQFVWFTVCYKELNREVYMSQTLLDETESLVEYMILRLNASEFGKDKSHEEMMAAYAELLKHNKTNVDVSYTYNNVKKSILKAEEKGVNIKLGNHVTAFETYMDFWNKTHNAENN